MIITLDAMPLNFNIDDSLRFKNEQESKILCLYIVIYLFY